MKSSMLRFMAKGFVTLSLFDIPYTNVKEEIVTKYWRCKKCGGRSYSGDWCSTCDRGILRSGWRSKWLHIMIVAWGILIVSLCLIAFNPAASIGCSATASILFLVAISNSLWWGKKIRRSLFEKEE